MGLGMDRHNDTSRLVVKMFDDVHNWHCGEYVTRFAFGEAARKMAASGMSVQDITHVVMSLFLATITEYVQTDNAESMDSSRNNVKALMKELFRTDEFGNPTEA